MKKFVLIILLLAIASVSAVAQSSYNSSQMQFRNDVNKFVKDDGTTMSPIIEKTQSLVKYIEDEAKQEIVRIEMDILSTTKTTYRSLQQGYTYQIIAYGDFRFKDIDISVYRWNGTEWIITNKDVDNSGMAMVSITPSQTSDYRIDITAYKFNDNYSVGHYGVIVCHEK